MMIVILLVMMVVVMIVMYLYISDLCWSSGRQVRASFWNSNPADPESRFEGQNMRRVGVLELDQGSNCPSHCQGWGGIEFGLGRILTKHDERRTRTLP